MTKEEKLVVINAIAEQLQAYPHAVPSYGMFVGYF